MIPLLRLLIGAAAFLLGTKQWTSAEISLEFHVDEALPPGFIIGHIDDPSRPEIPPPPYIVMANYQEAVERDFFINENTGEIRTRVYLDREAVDRYSFVAVPLLGGNNVRVSIGVVDVNDHAPVFKETFINLNFSESQPRDTRRSLPPALDPDLGVNTTQRYEITAGNINNVFRLSSRRGRDGVLYLDLEINGVLDRETVDHYLLSIDAFDGGNPPKSGRLTVNITLLDENDNVPLFTQSRYHAAVYENASIGAVIIQVEATDSDAGKNGEVFYSINRRQSDADHVFSVDPMSGEIRLSKPLDYETRTSYELVITATDKGQQALESSTFLRVDVLNVLDSVPSINVVFLHNGTNHVPEDIPVGAGVARLSIASQEELEDSSRIALELTGISAGHFDLAPESKSVFMLKVRTPLDYEQMKNYSLIIEARDSSNPLLMTEKTINIYVDDVNEPPSFRQQSFNATVDWNTLDDSTVLLRVQAEDGDEGVNGQLEYFIIQGASGQQGGFRIDPQSGIIVASEAFDCQSDVAHLTVGVRDRGLPSLTATAAVHVIFQYGQDDVPVFDQPFYNLTLSPDDIKVGNCFFKVEARFAGTPSKCKEHHSEIHYAFHASWTDDHLQINPQTGQICVRSDFAAGAIWNDLTRQVVVQADISGSNKSTSTLVQMALPPVVLFKNQHFIADTFQVVLNNMVTTGTPVVQVNAATDAADSTEESNFVYSILAGNEKALFTIDAVSGLITTQYELENHIGTYKLTVTVRGGSDKLTIEQLEVLIEVSRKTSYFINRLYKFSVPANAPVDTFIGVLQTNPQLPSARLTIQEPEMGAIFKIDENNAITMRKAIDRIERNHYAFHVQTESDGSSGRDVCQVLINVKEDDSQPATFPSKLLDLYIPENATTGEAIFRAIADQQSQRRGSSYSYSLHGRSADYFHLDSATGILYLHRSLDYEAATMHEILIVANKVGVDRSHPVELLLRIHVLDRNEHAPVFEKTLYQIAINESFPTDHPLFSVQAVDLDAGASGRVSYHIHEDGSAHLFTINPNTGSVVLKAPVDREQATSHVFTVVASDGGSPQLRAKALVNITVTDVNDNAPQFSEAEYIFSVTENTNGKVFVGKTVVTDPDEGLSGRVHFSLTCNGSGFVIDENNGEMFSTIARDRETAPCYSCQVVAKDYGFPALSSTASILVSVSDVNDHDPTFDPEMESAIFVPEGEPEGTEVIRITARDADSGDNGRVVYSLEKNEDASAFSIHPSSGILRTQIVLDHEKTNMYHITVIAADKGSPSRSARLDLTITVVDLNDHRPTFSTNVVTFQVIEGTPAGVEIGSVVATDADAGENGKVTYSIVRGNSFGAFEVGRTSGKIFTAREVDHELTPSYMLRIRAVDGSSIKPRSNLLVVNIIVIDINDSAPKFSTDSCLFTVRENTPLGTAVWNFTASDADSGSYGQVLFEIPYQSPYHGFKIHPATGVLSVAELIDYERAKSFSLAVTASDRDPDRTSRKSATLKCHIVVEDENDNSPRFVSRNIIKVTEQLAVGSPITHMVALDEDSYANGNVSYEIRRGNEDAVFSLDALTGVISLARNPSLLSRNSYALTVVATDNGTPRLATMHSLTIEIDSPPKNLKIFNQTVFEISVAEDANPGTSLLKFDLPQAVLGTIRFSVPDEFHNGLLAVDSRSGEVKLVRSLDRETTDSHILNIYATNKINPLIYDFATIRINVTDVNDNAANFQDSCQGLSVPENNEFGVVHHFTAFDKDEGENGIVMFRIESGNKGGKFIINAQTGQLSSKPLDREEQDQYTLLVVAEDQGKPSRQTVCRFTIHVLDSNDNAPVFLQQRYLVHLSEESPINTTLVQVQATDKDANQNAEIVYAVVNDTRRLLSIDPYSGWIRTTGLFDREELPSYKVEVTASDSGVLRQQSTSVILEFIVDDENDNAPAFETYYQKATLPGIVVGGTVVAAMSASDVDFGKNGELTYSFDKYEKDFDIDARSGMVRVRRDLSAQNGKTHRLTVVASDKGDNPKSSVGILDVMVGDSPSAVDLKFANAMYTATIMENKRAGTEVATVKATRSDGRDRRIRYSIVDGNIGNVFEIDQSGTVSVRDSTELDYERHKHFNLTIQAQSDGLDPSQAFTRLWVNLLDENDNGPQFLQSNFKTSVWEGNNKGTFVTQMTAFDEDSGRNSMLTYEIIDGNYDNAFSIEPAYTGIVKTNIILDREVHDNYRLTIIAKDKGVPQRTGTCTLRILIVDVNDNEPVFPQLSPVYVSEGASIGTVITTVTANDVDVPPETGPHLTYSIPKDSPGAKTFTINPITGAISLAANLDRESKARYRLNIEASDKKHNTLTNLTIIVTDVNDNPPVFTQNEYRVTVPEMTPSGTDLLTVTAKDADEGVNAKIKYSIKISPLNIFTIDENTGVLRTNRTVVFDPMNSMVNLVISAEDQGHPRLSTIAPVQVQITGTNRNAPVFVKSVYSVHIAEDAPLGQFVVQVSASDPDEKSKAHSVTYSIDNDPEGVFQIDRRNGKVMLLKRLDRETTASYALRIVASDLGKPMRNATAELIVNVDDINDCAPQFNQTEYKDFVSESAPIGSLIRKVKAIDFDSGENASVRYSIVSGNDASLFRINPISGGIEVASELDYENASEYKLLIQATDSGEKIVQSAVVAATIYLQDSNDHAPQFTRKHFTESVAENSPIGTKIFTARAHDRDRGMYGKLKYSISSIEGTDQFAIDPSSGEITSKTVLDYETKQQYNFVVTASDVGGSRADVQVTVNILGEDEYEPVFSRKEYRFYIAPDSKKGTCVGQVQATDRDAGEDGKIVYRFHRPSEIFALNETDGSLTLLMDFVIENNTTVKRSLQPELIIADSGKSGSKSDAALVFVILGTPEQEAFSSDSSQIAIITGAVCGVVAIALVITGIVCIYASNKRRKNRGGAYSSSFDVLQYSTFRGLDGSSIRTDLVNHYQDPSHNGPVLGPSTSVASRSSGRGSAEYEDERMYHDHTHLPVPKTSGYFPRMMPDSGLPEADYSVKVPIPASNSNSSESIYHFNDEGGCEGDCSDFYGQPPRSRGLSSYSHASSQASNNMSSRNEPTGVFERELRAEMKRHRNFEYLLWTPDYGAMSAVYAEIGELPSCASNQSRMSQFRDGRCSDGSTVISPSAMCHSKSSSHTTLPNALSRAHMHHDQQGQYF